VSKRELEAEKDVDCGQAKKIIMRNMRLHGVDVKDLTLSKVKEDGVEYIQPESRQLSDGTWMPILDWSFVSFDPTRKSFRIAV